MKPIRKGWIIWPPVIIVRYWLVQGMLYMNWVERLHRLSLELLVFCVLYLLVAPLLDTQAAVVAAFLIAHTLSAVLNGHMFAMFTHDLFWFGLYKDRQKFLYYMEEMKARISRKAPQYLSGAVFFGSLARGVFRDTSDLDIRFIAEDGFWNEYRTAHLVFIERFHALLAGYPIDTYMFRTEQEVRRKMDVENEHPVPIYVHGEKLYRAFPETVSWESFRDDFAAGKTREHD